MRKTTIIFFILFILFSCSKDDKDSITFSNKLLITNDIEPNPNLWSNYSEQNDELSVNFSGDSYSINGWESSLNINTSENLNLTYGQTIEIDISYNISDGNTPLIRMGEQNYIASEFAFWVNDGDIISWNMSNDFVFGATGENPVESNTNPLVGKWVNLNGCTNANSEQSYFQFNSDNTGRIFNSDCASACAGYGYFLNFNWTDNGSSIGINYTSVSEYCGVQAPTPSPETLNYSISGNQLSIGGASWNKQ